jgi:hypothetical protein
MWLGLNSLSVYGGKAEADFASDCNASFHIDWQREGDLDLL